MTQEYRLEEELQEETPRRVVHKRRGLGGIISLGRWYVFLAPFIFCGVLTFLLAAAETMVAYRGVAMSGTVFDRSAPSRADSSDYAVVFTYQYHGRKYTGYASVREDEYNRTELKQHVIVYALPWAPALFPELAGASGQYAQHRKSSWIFALVWNTILAFLIAAPLRLRWNARRLVANGVPTSACIIEKSNVIGGGDLHSMRYEFTPLQAPSASIRAKQIVMKEDGDFVAIGDVVTVLYHEKKPRRNIIYRFAPFQAVPASPPPLEPLLVAAAPPQPYQPEDELLTPTPRRIVQVAPGAVSIGFARGMIAITAVMVVFFLEAAIEQSLVEYRGVAVPAVVSSRTDNTNSEGGTYRVNFNYRRPGAVYSGFADISQEDFTHMSVGRPLMVKALPWALTSRPKLLNFESEYEDWLRIDWFFAVSSILLAALTTRFVFRLRIDRGLIGGGAPIAATIMKKREILIDEAAIHFVVYEYLHPQKTGAVVKGFNFVTKEQWDTVSVGDAVTALYDPARPKCHIIYQWGSHRVMKTTPHS